MSAYPDWQPAHNIRDAPELYELENRALDPEHRVLAAMWRIAPWGGRTLVDLGCGSGFWLERYAEQAAEVIGVEPDPELAAAAGRRSADVARVTVLAGSAEHLPLPAESVDVVHARFAYFFGPGAEAGLAEVLRVLRPGGCLVVVDNDYQHAQFAELLRAATQGNALLDPEATDEWWRERGAQRVEVLSEWRFDTAADLAAVLRNEFRDGTADGWLARHPGEATISYAFVLFAVTR